MAVEFDKFTRELDSATDSLDFWSHTEKGALYGAADRYFLKKWGKCALAVTNFFPQLVLLFTIVPT